MKHKILRLLLVAVSILFSVHLVNAQGDTLSLRGTVINSQDQSALAGATVMLISIKDSTKNRYQSADANGRFYFENLEQAFYRIKISSIGYKGFEKLFRLQLKDSDLGAISLTEDVVALEEVSIEEQLTPVQQKGDTTQYNADAFKTNPDATSADLVKKMPGIEVTSQGVTANGETVEQVLLDGKRFFGQDPLLSLNSIPAEIVDKVLVYDEESDQSRLTGIKDGNTTKTMDIRTKSGKQNGQFGNVYAGLGDGDLYKAGGNINLFNGDRRITILGMSNNINQQNFGQEDLIGLSGSGGRGGFRRGGGGSFNTGEQAGITQTNSLGINFIDEWSEKIKFEGSYFLNRTDNVQEEILNRQTYLDTRSQIYQEVRSQNNLNTNHRLNMRLDAELSEKSTLLFRSNMSLQDRESKEITLGQTFIESDTNNSVINNEYINDGNSYNINNTLRFQHKFDKIGRTVSVNVNQQLRPSEQDISLNDLALDSLTDYLSNADNQQYEASVTYTEPVGSFGLISTGYEYQLSMREATTEVFGVAGDDQENFVSSLSNDFESDYTYHQPSVGYALNKTMASFNVNIAYQTANLENASLLGEIVETNNQFTAILPSITGRFRLTKKISSFASYRTNTTAPSISQLQDVVNNTNPLFITLGNPDLDQTYTHALRMGFFYTNSETNTTFSNFSSIQTSMNYIGDEFVVLRSDTLINDVQLQRGAQLTTPTNLDGYWSVFNSTNFGKAIPKIKNNLNASLRIRYSRIPTSVEGELNYSNNFSTAIKLGLSSNISEKIDYNIYYQIDGSQVNNSLQGSSDRFYTQTIATEFDITLIEDVVWRNETYFQYYNSTSSNFNTRYVLWNMGVAKKFLKNKQGELELSVFDLLGQNQSFSQTVNSAFLEEVETRVLQQFFMLTFTYQIKNFK